MSEPVFVIYEPTRDEIGDVVGIATSQVVASMANQAGYTILSNLPIFHTTQEFISWAEGNHR